MTSCKRIRSSCVINLCCIVCQSARYFIVATAMKFKMHAFNVLSVSCACVCSLLTCLIILFVCGPIDQWINFNNKNRNQSGEQTTKNRERCRARFVCSLPCCHIMEISIPVCCFFFVFLRRHYHFIAIARSYSVRSFVVPYSRNERQEKCILITLSHAHTQCNSIYSMETKLRFPLKWYWLSNRTGVSSTAFSDT